MNEFNAYLISNDIDICFGSETHLHSEISDNMISLNHTIHRIDRNKYGGGVMIGISDRFKSVPIHHNYTHFESVIIQAFISNDKYILSTIYVKPNPTIETVCNLHNYFEWITNKFNDCKIIIGGDLNIDYLRKTKNIFKLYENSLKECGLTQIVNSFTYPSNVKYSDNPSIIDHIVVNCDIISNLEVNESIADTCDHLLIDFEIIVTKSNVKIESKRVYDYSNEEDMKFFENQLKSHNWSDIFNEELDINFIYNSLIEVILNYRNFAFRLKPRKKGFKHFDKYITNMIKTKRKWYKIYRQTKNELYLTYAKNLYQDISRSLQEYHSKQYETIINKSDNFKSLYKNVKQMSANSEIKIFLDDSNEYITNESEICNKFAETFSKNFTETLLPKYETNINRNNDIIIDFTISQTDVLREVLKFKTSKSCLNSELPNILFNLIPEVFSFLLFKLFNLILKKSTIPENLKLVTVIPIHKNGKPKDKFDSYRPVSIEKNILKLFCILIFNNINSIIARNYILPEEQYGFRPGFSTFHQIIDLIDTICNGFNDPNILCVDILFLDLSSAFDSITFDTILENCYDCGIRGNCLKILESYLYNRKLSVKYNGCHSETIPIVSGTPQGGVGSPTLFNLSIRNLPHVKKQVEFSNMRTIRVF